MLALQEAVEAVGLAIEAVGVLVIVTGLVFALGRFALRRASVDQPFRRLREDIGKGILLGLEFLVAADIVRRSHWPRPSRPHGCPVAGDL